MAYFIHLPFYNLPGAVFQIWDNTTFKLPQKIITSVEIDCKPHTL